MSCYEIAGRVGVDHSYVWRILKELAPDLAKAKDLGRFLKGKAGRKRMVDVQKAEMMLADGKSLKEISEVFDCNMSTLWRSLKRSNIAVPDRVRLSQGEQAFQTILQEGLPLAEAAVRFDCSETNIRRIAQKRGYAFRGGRPILNTELEARLAERVAKSQKEPEVVDHTPSKSVDESVTNPTDLADSAEWQQHIQNMKKFIGSDRDYCRRNKLDLDIFQAYKKKYGIKLRDHRHATLLRRKR
jgi:hypothetical protein